jgi:hypothetical protein
VEPWGIRPQINPSETAGSTNISYPTIPAENYSNVVKVDGSSSRSPEARISNGYDDAGSGAPKPLVAGAPGRASSSNSKNQTRPSRPGGQQEIRRVWIYVSGREVSETGQESQREKMELEKKSIDFVMNVEKLEGREPLRFEGNNKGFDILSVDPIGGPTNSRYIEVKATASEWGARGISLTPSQMQFAWHRGNSFWLYVVENASEPKASKLHRIQNPALYAAGFRFNDAWKQLASLSENSSYSEDPEELTISDGGRRFKHDVYGPGWITFVEEFEDGLMAQLWYSKNDSPDKDFVKWDPKVMHKED